MNKDTTQLNKLASTLDVIHEKIDGINNHLKDLNGKTITSMKDIQGLKINETSIISSIRGGKTVGIVALGVITILIGTISSLSVYIYGNNKKTLEQQTAEVANKASSVASDLALYEVQTQQKSDEIISLLKTIVRK